MGFDVLSEWSREHAPETRRAHFNDGEMKCIKIVDAQHLHSHGFSELAAVDGSNRSERPHFVEGILKSEVVRLQCTDNVPDRAVCRVFEHIRRVDWRIGWNENWHDYSSDLVWPSWIGSHDSTDGLDDVNLAAPRICEHHAVECRHINAFGQTARVCEQSCLVSSAEPLQAFDALRCVRRAGLR